MKRGMGMAGSASKISDQIYSTIKRRIVTIEYKPGTILSESELSAEFKASRTPVREIFQRLELEKLVTILSRVGAQVAPIDYRYYKSLMEVKRGLDVMIVRLAVRRMTQESLDELDRLVQTLKEQARNKLYNELIPCDMLFHQIIIEQANNEVLSGIYDNVMTHTERFWHYSMTNLTYSDEYITTYADLLGALRNKDEAQAEKYATGHVDLYINALKNDLFDM